MADTGNTGEGKRAWFAFFEKANKASWSYMPQIDDLRPLGIRTHHAKVNAIRAGTRNAPASSGGDSPDFYELNLKARYESDLNRIDETLRIGCANADKMISDCLPEAFDPAAYTNEFKKEEAEIFLRNRQELLLKYEETQRASSDLEAFKFRHRLNREAMSPKDTVWTIIIFGLFLLIETVANTLLFAAGDPASNALTTALNLLKGISLGVIVLCAGGIFGFFGLRYLGYVNDDSPVETGLFRSISYIVITVILLAYGTLLVSMSITRLEVLGDVAARLLVDPTVDTISESIVYSFGVLPLVTMFALISISSFIFAALKSYDGFTDPFPRFSAVDKARRAADLEYEKKKSELILATERATASIITKVDDALRGDEDLVRRARAINVESVKWQGVVIGLRSVTHSAYLAEQQEFRQTSAHIATQPEIHPEAHVLAAPEEVEVQSFDDLVNEVRNRHHDNQRQQAELIQKLADMIQGVSDRVLKLVEDLQEQSRRDNKPYGRREGDSSTPTPE